MDQQIERKHVQLQTMYKKSFPPTDAAIANETQIELNFNQLGNQEWKLVAFDLDGTLAPSKSALPPKMASSLRELLQICDVAVISGGALPQFELQLLQGLNATPSQLRRLHLMPTCGTRYLNCVEDTFVEHYSHNLSEKDRKQTLKILELTAREQGIWESKTCGPILEDRGSQITYSALGQKAPLLKKEAWDPTGQKKARLAHAVQQKLSHLEVRSGGSTSVDVTEKGIDKAYGMKKLVEITGVPKPHMLFIGDRLDPIGNDYPVKKAGWPTYPVEDWEDTAAAIDHIVAAQKHVGCVN